MNLIDYDLEVYPNIFTFGGFIENLDQYVLFEISDRKNEKNELISFLNWLIKEQYSMVGFNNINYDYEFIHEILTSPYTFTYQRAYQISQSIFDSQKFGEKYRNVYFKDRLIPQIDLWKMNHFDNKAKSCSLKALQFAMRSDSVEDLPYDIRPLTNEEKDNLIAYQQHDIIETHKFRKKCMPMLLMRKEIIDENILYGDVFNYSDVKIGVEFLIKEIGREKCFTGYGKPRQTVLNKVNISDILLPNHQFRNEEYEQVLEKFKSLKWYRSKEEREILEDDTLNFEYNIDGFTYHFGSGGIHGSVDKQTFISNDKYSIIDLDVGSMYPSVAVENNFYPTHLGEEFVGKYAGLKSKRNQYKKGTTKNKTFKLSQNGAFGNSNNPFSPLLDASFLLKITINGQLQLLKLAEMMSFIPDLKIIQVNTDGITCYVNKDYLDWFEMVKIAWQDETRLELEQVVYSKMFIRDVNNYLSIDTKGKIKAKGAYWYPKSDEDYEGNWHKDFSAMIVPKAIQEVLVNNFDLETVVKLNTNRFDFMLRYKTPKGTKVYIGDTLCPKTVRYYVSKTGEPMKKVANPKGPIGAFKRRNGLTDTYYNQILNSLPPDTWDERIHTKNKSKYAIQETSIENNYKVKICNKASEFDWSDVDYDYYIEQTKKLLIDGEQNEH